MLEFFKYFPKLSEHQKIQFEALQKLYEEWNLKINVISRRDIDHLYEHHVQHSLAISCFVEDQLGGWQNGVSVLDVGTGGGFPGIPLAILYPHCKFLLIDRIGKKIRVTQEVANAIGLTNVECRHSSVEEVKESFDFVVSRAVMALPDLVKLSYKNMRQGLLCLKGGDLTEEFKSPYCKDVIEEKVSHYFQEDFFETKRIIFVPKHTS